MDETRIIRVDVVDKRIGEIQREMRVLEEQLQGLRVERNLLARLRAESETLSNGKVTHKGSDESRRPGPTDALLQLIEAEPGITREDAVTRLEPVIRTKSKDRRKVLSTTIGNLLNARRLVEYDEHLYPKNFEQETIFEEAP